MSTLFQRRCRVTVDTLSVDNLRVTFNVHRFLRKEPNHGTIEIYNLSQATRAGMRSRGSAVTLQAGYENNIAQIFSGNSITIDHQKKGADWVTRIQVGDGQVNYQYNRISETHKVAAQVSGVVKSVIKVLTPLHAISKDTADALDSMTGTYPNGVTLHGNAADELSRVLPRGFEWSLQDGIVQILKAGQPTSEVAVLLSPGTGLIGSPEWGTPEPTAKRDKSQTLKVKAQIQATLKPGGQARVETRDLKGNFRIEKVEHRGDTHGGDWVSELECTPIA